jgi:putative resolvase
MAGSQCIPTRSLVSIGKAARLANVNPQTIRRYLASGQIFGTTTPGKHRRLDLRSVAEAFGVNLPDGDKTTNEESGRIVLAYARVSTQKQKAEGNLDRQVERPTARIFTVGRNALSRSNLDAGL